jgi:hypothetical protein
MASEHSRVFAALTREIHEAMRELRMLQSETSGQLRAARKITPFEFMVGVRLFILNSLVLYQEGTAVYVSIEYLLSFLWGLTRNRFIREFPGQICTNPVCYPTDMRAFLTKVISEIDNVISPEFTQDVASNGQIGDVRRTSADALALIP